MLTRRHIRVKVLQSLYAYNNQENANLQKQEVFLIDSMLKMHELYLHLLNLQNAILKEAGKHMEKSMNKFLPTAQDSKPSKNFVENKVLLQISNNTYLQQLLKKCKLVDWTLDTEYPQILFNELKGTEEYKTYLKLPSPTFDQDREFVLFIYKKIIAPNEKLYDYLEDKQISWVDDIPIVNTAMVKIMNSVKPSSLSVSWIPKLYKNEDDEDFARKLFQKTIVNDIDLIAEVEGKTPNWDRERIAELDLMLIKMGITEMLNFSSIPVRVTINEYLEIAKEYSTPKSSIFINGVLDRIVKEYEKSGKLNKIGRGLQ